MNYISHYYCLKDKNPYTILGALLPDILPRFSYFHNKYFLHYDPSRLSQEEIKLWVGIEQHYADDAFFHSSPFFKQGMTRIDEELYKHHLLRGLKRKFLVSHVLYELMLDQMILDRYPDSAHAIYKELDTVDLEVLSTFLRNIVKENEGIELFLDSYSLFLRRRFLNFYALPENLVKSLHMVSGKISQWEYNNEIVEAFVSIILKVKEETDFDFVFDAMFKHRDLA